MGKEYSAKSFKSGNSVAIRMPAALGITPDQEWTVIEEAGRLVLNRKDMPKRKFDIDAIWGIAKGSGMRPFEPHERLFEDRSSEAIDDLGLAAE